MSLAIEMLCNTFRTQAHWTDDAIRGGLSTRLGILEETLTDQNLIGIASKHSDYIFTKKFNRKQEANISGADWIWCIGGPKSWLSLAIQAKIVKPESGKCHYLNYRRGEQHRLLINFARKYRLLPLYCIYSHIPFGYVPNTKAIPEFSGLAYKDWGCSLVFPRHIKALIKARRITQQDILAYGIPWMQPFCIPEVRSDKTLAETVVSNYQRLREELKFHEDKLRSRDKYQSFEVGQIASINSATRKTRIQWNYPDPSALLAPNIPSFVLNLLREKGPANSPVPNIGIISTIPVQAVLQEQGILPAPAEDSSGIHVTTGFNSLNLEERR